MSLTQHEVQEVAANLETLLEKEHTQSSTTEHLHESAAPTEQPSKTKRPRPRIKELRVNLGDLSAAADRLGIDAASRTGYQSLLDRLLLSIPNTLTEPAAPDPNQLLAPLLQELAAIKQQVSAGQAGEELEQLRQQTQQQQQEIDRLQAELEKANDRLKQIVQTAQGNAPQPHTATPQAAPIQAIAPRCDAERSDKSIAVPTKPQAINQQPVSQFQRSQPGRPPAGKLSPADRVPLAIVALMHHNQQCHPTERWFLSGNIIATAAGANPALVVTPWLQSHPIAMAQIDQHNTAIGLNARSNGKEKDRGQLKPILNQFIEGKSQEELQAIVQKFETQIDMVF